MPDENLHNGFKVGAWQVEPRSLSVSGPGGDRTLTSQAMCVLCRLAARRGSAVPRDQLIAHCLGGGAGDEGLVQVIHELQTIFGLPDGRSTVITLHGVGCMLTADVAGDNPQPAPAAPPGDVFGLIRELFDELRNRRMFRAAFGYVTLAFAGFVVTNEFVQGLDLPRWISRAYAAGAALGLPLTLALAWRRERVRSRGGGSGTAFDWRRFRPLLLRLSLLALLLACCGALLYVYREQVFPAARHSLDTSSLIVVLPFKSGAGSRSGDGFSTGLSEETASAIKQFGLRVISPRTLTPAQLDDVRSMGKALNVDFAVDGSVFREGERVRVLAELVNTATGEKVWDRAYDRTTDDLLSTQVEIAESIVREMALANGLDAGTRPRAVTEFKRARTEQSQAYVNFVEARGQLHASADPSSLAKADRLFRAALALDPGFAAAHAGLCEVGTAKYARNSDPANLAQAEASCDRALQLAPSLVETARARARLAAAAGQFKESEAMFRALLKQAAGDSELHIGLARALVGQDRGVEAEQSFRDAVQAEPDRWTTHNTLGTYLWSQGRYREAETAFEDALRIAPDSATVINNLGAVQLQTGDFAAAQTTFLRSLRIEPTIGAYSNLGAVYYYQDRPAEAVKAYEQAAALAPHDYHVHGNLAEALWRLPAQHAAAVDAYRKASGLLLQALSPPAAGAAETAILGLFLARSGEPDRAQGLLEQARRLGADSDEAQYWLAVAAADRRDYEQALASLRRAVELGYSPRLIAAAPDFAALRRLPEFRSLVSGR